MNGLRTDEIMDLIDNATHPDKMTKREALTFLEEISAQLVGRTDALEAEIEEEDEEG